MKTMIKNFGTLIICMFASMVFADITPEVTITAGEGQAFILQIENPDGDAIYVRVKDSEGNTLQDDMFRTKEQLVQKYNLDELPDGEYTVVITEGVKTIVQPVLIGEDRIALHDHLRAEFFAPAVVLNESKLDFTMLSIQESQVKIEILDELGRVNYTASTNEKGSMQRRFDVSALEPGQYRLITTVEAPGFETSYSDVFVVDASFAGN